MQKKNIISSNIFFTILVYLRTTPEVVLERILKRGRAEELEISLEYLHEVGIVSIFVAQFATN